MYKSCKGHRNLILHVVSYLNDGRDVLSLRALNKRWNFVIDSNPKIWIKYLADHYDVELILRLFKPHLYYVALINLIETRILFGGYVRCQLCDFAEVGILKGLFIPNEPIYVQYVGAFWPDEGHLDYYKMGYKRIQGAMETHAFTKDPFIVRILKLEGYLIAHEWEFKTIMMTPEEFYSQTIVSTSGSNELGFS